MMIFKKLAEGIWLLDGNPISFLTFPYEIRSTFIDIGKGDLFIHSPVQLYSVDLLKNLPGKVKYIVSLNKLHSLFLGDWVKAFPEARFYAPPGLKARLQTSTFRRNFLINQSRNGKRC